MTQKQQIGVLAVLLALVGVAALYLVQKKSAQNSSAGERKPMFYQDSMHPWVKSDRPGKCTICDMDLTPIYEGQAAMGSSSNLVVLSSNQVTVLNVQTEPVKRRQLIRSLRVSGTLEANETRKTVVSAPARGRIDELAVDYPGVEVEQGQKLITMFSPELVQLRKTLLAVKQATPQTSARSNSLQPTGDPGLYTGEILAPQSGVVLERNVNAGQYVAEGDRLLTIADASVLWFRFDVYQPQLPWFEPGETMQVEVSGVPGKAFAAVISFVEPAFNDATRTVKVRADISNPLVEVSGHKRRLLKYGMYAEGHVRSSAPDVLAVPRTAILLPGGAAYVYVEKGGGAYERRRLKLGRQGDEFFEVLKGVEEGETVVTAGNMLIDAQAQFNAPLAVEEPGNEEPNLAPEVVSIERVDSAPSMGTGSMKATAPAVPPQVLSSAPRRKGNASSARTDRMSAVMSPGAELQTFRRETILRERAMNATNTTGLSASQREALQAMLSTADGISQALSSDDVAKFSQLLTNSPNALLVLPSQFGSDHRWGALIARVSAIAKSPPTADLAEARKQFLPFSTALVDLVKQLKKEGQVVASVKVYHCPMAPPPGLWIQAKGPLANPFYGSKMLRCGEEVPL